MFDYENGALAPSQRKRPSRAARLRLALAAAFAGALAGCAIATPYKTTDAGAALPKNAPTVVAVTLAVVSDDRAARKVFWENVWRIERALPEQPGLLGYSLRQELLGNKAWTMTAWRSEEDLRRFVASPLHRQAIDATPPALVDSRFVRVARTNGQLPLRWDEALEELSRGRQGY
jgi:heme-degrading monooxygenase HmoA